MHFLKPALVHSIFIIVLVFPSLTHSQLVSGVIIDSISGQKLPYVNIGVEGKNAGSISNDKGEFKIDLSKVNANEKISFSMIGYHTALLSKDVIDNGFLKVKLIPQHYELKEIEVVSRESKTIKLGRFKNTKTTTGHGGFSEFGFGGEWGIKIKHPGKDFYLKDVNFHTRFNTVDSVLYRINVYELDAGKPGKSMLEKEVFAKSYKKDKWIRADMLKHGILIQDDVIVSFEIIRIWHRNTNKNLLFFSIGKGYEEGGAYLRESSFDDWKIDVTPPMAIYVRGLEQ